MIYTVQNFVIVSETEVGVFLEFPFSVILSIFTKSQASSPFEAMNSAHLNVSKGCEDLCPEEVEEYSFL